MEILDYFERKKEFQANFLEYFDNESNSIGNFDNFTKYIIDLKINENRNELMLLLQLILHISNNHHRHPDFFHKLKYILQQIKDVINHSFSNFEIFEIFQSNKRILLFLIQESLFAIDQSIFDIIKDENFQRKEYLLYFWPEIQPFLTEEMFVRFENENNDIIHKNQHVFQTLRKEGENDSDLCAIIRNDSCNEFISYINSPDFYLSKMIYPSPFETNQFLLFNTPTLIEYAAFFGSFKIFQYLQNNNFEIRPSIWLYAIHGRNMKIIQFLEENKIEPDDKTFSECFIESIKCHHNEIAIYIQDKFLAKEQSEEQRYLIWSKIVQYLNFSFFPNNYSNIFIFYSFCQNNYLSFVEVILKNIKIDINSKIVQINPSGLNVTLI